MAQTVAQIEARLANVRAAIDTVIAGGISSISHEGGDQTTVLSLSQLQEYESQLQRQLAATRRGGIRFRAARMFQ